mmetsp:Transcript_10081/g.19757  ORF Transcript_10081/g.19757 Transcript_10081/m.19757 type:complete len:485 (-) Transcript_10081:205-1659(-)|eukprot:CAMPEP_0171518408 /NCGR_PEP_ID=MMETSP0959-20130129/5250_1 /TAXON_ID=87120 /ORGANISM="Aurantiochytrium limacinum, Strain ATCCMYA-1381" /LENGTH=484 /DNA_ID=CAMNT_0012057575 /DNA_START=20 /DNA_END=1474 /DNA_ORIENTATION=-
MDVLPFEEIPLAELGVEPTHRPQVADPFMRMAQLRHLMGSPRIWRVSMQASDGEVSTVHVHDEESLERVLRDDSGLWLKGPQTVEPFTSIVPMHLIALDGALQGRLRGVAMRVVNEQLMTRVMTVVHAHALRLREFWLARCHYNGRPTMEHETIALDRAIRATATDVISELVLGEPWGALEGLRHRKGIERRVGALRELMMVLHWRIVDLSDRRWRTGEQGAATSPLAILKPVLQQAIQKARSEAVAVSEASKDQVPWVKLFVDDDTALSDAEIENLCLTFLTMGHENISSTISWSLIHLAENPDVQDRVRVELKNSGLFRDNSVPSWVELQRLKTLEAAFLESARLMPSVAAITRCPSRDTDLAGYMIPKGQEVVFSLYGYHRDERYFGHDAGSFECPHVQGHAAVPRPFGGGPRACLGRPLSSIESKLFIGILVSTFRLSSVIGHTVRPYNFVSLRPGAHRIVLERLDGQTAMQANAATSRL